MMKKDRKSFPSRRHSILLAVIMMITLVAGLVMPSVNTRAAKDYTYTVRVFAGKQGNIGGAAVKEFDGLAYGEEFSFNPIQQATVKEDSKYYVKGMRESGKDNNTSLAMQNFKVTRDVDYVIAYGLKGNLVEYTVRFVEAGTNTQLADPETYYGNVGDKPVVSYKYIEGYFPNANNMTGTLKEDASKNVFTFQYQKIVEEETTTTAESEAETTTRSSGDNNTPTPTRSSPNPTSPAPTTRANQETTTAASGSTAETTTTTAPAQPEQPTQPTQPPTEATSEGAVAEENELQNPPTEPTLPSSPDEVPDLIDIDEGPVPLAEFSGASDEGTETGSDSSSLSPNDNVRPGSGLSTSKIIVIAVGAALLIALAVIFLLRRRRYDDEEDEDDEDDEDDYDE